MMDKAIHIHLPAGRRLVWYLAAEEYFAQRIRTLVEGHGYVVQSIPLLPSTTPGAYPQADEYVWLCPSVVHYPPQRL